MPFLNMSVSAIFLFELFAKLAICSARKWTDNFSWSRSDRKDARRLFGIGTDRFLISWLDVT